MANDIHAQLGFCNGNSGDPIFTENFGSGTTNGPALSSGTTSYSYTSGQPIDGSYTISSSTPYFDWFNIDDRTPGDTNGKALIVNASYTAGEFFRRTIDDLCENTSYEFSSWLINLLPSTSGCPNGGIPINVKFQIWDNTDTNLLASGDTGSIFGKTSPTWEQYGLVFQTLPGQTSVILKMLNNGAGGCGNDLAIDDIVFRTCGDRTTLTDTANNTNILGVCKENTPTSIELTATPDFSVYSTHAYQWQESTDGINWNNIIGETNQKYTSPPIFGTTYYRAKVAEDAINLSNPKCNTVSDVFQVIIEGKPNAPVHQGDVTLCAGETGGVSASVPNGITIDWYDTPTGGNLLLAGNSFYETKTNGTYYAEAVTKIAGCFSDTRTAVSIVYNDLPVLQDEKLILCEGEAIVLSANFPNASYSWSTAETSPQISVDTPGTYTVKVTDMNACSATKTIEVTQIDKPIIQDIVSNHRDLTILTKNSGNFEYSLNGFIYQDSPLFENLKGGTYTAYVREKDYCSIVQFPFTHIVIPKFFTPNGDNFNDNFKPEGIETFANFEIRIFDRTSKLIAQSKNKNYSWNGTYNGRPLPASDYWYVLKVGESLFKGHFALKR
ncbi:T9SS type B sorting domain-containing protein [Flagellimonas pacifica]|uniref:Gliding motility-associated C-terminal domain-containing protein n=1 Tax=Flagellimonas pacifica TaxID=1247520 RepID=A0A285MC11_9FLAO|nr:T9SS type B sorting domain-containing protein [Allomuricauda parva]SNY94628.1 gliding motility-associated C-terminal domain-containing protein [Allomuricauda parva]